MKKIVCILLSLALCCSLLPMAFAYGNVPSEDDLNRISSGIKYPKASSYLSEYKYGNVRPNGNNYAVKGYKSASLQDTKSICTIDESDDITIIAKEGRRLCIISDSTDKACWVNGFFVNVDYSLGKAPSKDDLDDICAVLSYPAKKDYYSSYLYGEASPAGNHTAIKAYYSASNQDNISQFTIESGEPLTVLAKKNSRVCVIAENMGVACWVDANRVSIY